MFYPDRRPTQRVGILPYGVVRPTIERIAAGRDEVLEAAMRVIGDSNSDGIHAGEVVQR